MKKIFSKDRFKSLLAIIKKNWYKIVFTAHNTLPYSADFAVKKDRVNKSSSVLINISLFTFKNDLKAFTSFKRSKE